MAHQCLIDTNPKCVECHKLKNALIGTLHNGWASKLSSQKRSEKYQVAVMYQIISTSLAWNDNAAKILFVKLYPLPKRLEGCVYQEEVYPESSDSDDYTDIDLNETDSDQLFDNIISVQDRVADQTSEEEMQAAFLGSGKVVKYTEYPEKKLRPPPLPTTEWDDMSLIYRVRNAVFWFYDVTKSNPECTIIDIRVIPLDGLRKR